MYVCISIYVYISRANPLSHPLPASQAKAVELLKESKARLEAAFISSGNSFAGLRLASRNTAVGYANEATNGVSFYNANKLMLEQASFLYICVYLYIYIYIYVCCSMCSNTAVGYANEATNGVSFYNANKLMLEQVYIYTCMYIYIYVYVAVCVATPWWGTPTRRPTASLSTTPISSCLSRYIYM